MNEGLYFYREGDGLMLVKVAWWEDRDAGIEKDLYASANVIGEFVSYPVKLIKARDVKGKLIPFKLFTDSTVKELCPQCNHPVKGTGVYRYCYNDQCNVVKLHIDLVKKVSTQ